MNITNVKEAPVITVKTIKRKFVEALYSTRGELSFAPDKLSEQEYAVGIITSGSGVLVCNRITGNLRIMWPPRYAYGLGVDFKDQEAVREVIGQLPQIFID